MSCWHWSHRWITWYITWGRRAVVTVSSSRYTSYWRRVMWNWREGACIELLAAKVLSILLAWKTRVPSEIDNWDLYKRWGKTPHEFINAVSEGLQSSTWCIACEYETMNDIPSINLPPSYIQLWSVETLPLQTNSIYLWDWSKQWRNMMTSIVYTYTR